MGSSRKYRPFIHCPFEIVADEIKKRDAKSKSHGGNVAHKKAAAVEAMVRDASAALRPLDAQLHADAQALQAAFADMRAGIIHVSQANMEAAVMARSAADVAIRLLEGEPIDADERAAVLAALHRFREVLPRYAESLHEQRLHLSRLLMAGEGFFRQVAADTAAS